MNRLVSVITPAYNSQETLKISTASVLEQDYENLELLIIVNGCTDATGEIAESIAKSDSRVRVLHSEKGKVPSRNLGLIESRGDVIALNDADDVWLPGKLRKQVESLCSGVNIVAGKIECIDLEDRVSPDPLDRPTQHAGIVRSLLSGVNPIANSAAIFEKRILNHIGTYEDCFPFCEDYHFWLRAIKFGKFENLDEVVMRYRSYRNPDYDHNIPVALASFYKSLYQYTGVIA